MTQHIFIQKKIYAPCKFTCGLETVLLPTNSRAAVNSTYKKLAVQCSADTFVVNETLVLRINICGKNRQLLVAAKRYAQCFNDTI